MSNFVLFCVCVVLWNRTLLRLVKSLKETGEELASTVMSCILSRMDDHNWVVASLVLEVLCVGKLCVLFC